MTRKQTNSLKEALLQDKKRKLIQDKQEDKSDLVQLNFRIDRAAKKQLDLLCVEIEAKSIQNLMAEAINDLFEKYNKNRIA